ncbi:hypothetical protein YB2330_005387 [Saitoella coloradoensis]
MNDNDLHELGLDPLPQPAHEDTPVLPNTRSDKVQHPVLTTTASGSTEIKAIVQDVPPNGGYGWVVVAAAFGVTASSWGINSSFGVYLSHYLANDYFPGASSMDFAFVGGLSVSQAMLIAPLATYLSGVWHFKVVMTIGLVLEVGGLILSSFAPPRLWMLFLGQGVMFGWGMGFLFVPAIGLPGQWFSTRRALASGIMAAGSGFGGMAFSLGTNAMIQQISLPWAFRISAIVAGVVLGTAILLLRSRAKLVGDKMRPWDLGLLRNTGYVAVLAWGFLSMLGYIVALFSISSYAVATGMTQSQASHLSAIVTAAMAVGRPLTGYYGDRTGRINMGIGATSFAGLTCLLIWMFGRSYGVMIFFCILHGAVSGVFWVLCTPITAEVVGVSNLGAGLSMQWINIVLPTTFAEPIALALVQRMKDDGKIGADSYLGAIGFAGGTFVLAAAVLCWVKVWKQRKDLGKEAGWRVLGKV